MRCGAVSLVAALLAWGSWFLLILTAGMAVALGVTIPLFLVATLGGLAAIVTGIGSRQPAAILLGALAMLIVATGIWGVASAMNF
jgi:hypothetical protein